MSDSVGRRSVRGAARHRRAVAVTVALMMCASMHTLAFARDALAAPTGTVTSYAQGFDTPSGITAGPDGNMWFTSFGNNAIGRITPAGVVTMFTDPSISAPRRIAAGPDGSLWFTNSTSASGGGSIGRITTAGVVSNFTAGTINQPWGIAAGPDGNMWFTNFGNDSIGRVTPAGVVAKFLDTTNSAVVRQPKGISAGPDGNMWFTDFGNGGIGRVTPAGAVSRYTDGGAGLLKLPYGIAAGPDGLMWFTNSKAGADVAGSIGRINPTSKIVGNKSGDFINNPHEITAGADGNMWFTDPGNNSIKRMTTAKVVTSFTDPSVLSPEGIASGPDGALWFTNSGNNSIGRITTTGVVTSFVGSGASQPHGIAKGADGNLWFVNSGNNTIGRITTAGIVTVFTDPSISSPQRITAGPDGNLWFTNSGNNTIGRITPAGVVSSFEGAKQPNGIAAGLDGNLWFTNSGQNSGSNSIGRITTAGVVTTFGGLDDPRDITRGPDGNMWFTNGPHSISRITVAGAVTTYTNAAISSPRAITQGPDGNLWFTTSNANIGRITTAGAIVLFPDPAIGAAQGGIAPGPDGNVWFGNGGSIGRITPAGVVSTFSDPSVNGPAGIVAGPDGNMWFTNTYSSTIGRLAVNGVPGPPTAVTAIRGNTQVTVTWNAPALDGGTLITKYTVTASPGGATCVWTAGPLTCTVNGLSNGAAYSFTVTATNSEGNGPASTPSDTVIPATTPGAPPKPIAVAGQQQARVSWSYPPNDGGSSVTGYTVTASPGGASCSAPGGTTMCTVVGLTNGTSYTFTVTATNAVGTGPPSAPSDAVRPEVFAGYHPVAPTRILDSRGPNGGWNAKLAAGVPFDLQVTGRGGASNVPVNASAVVMNMTVTSGTAPSFVTVYPSGTATPTASNLNFGAGQTIANLVTVKVGGAGLVRVANAVGSVDVIADVVGYYDDGTGPGDLYTGITPTRLLDSRTANGGWNATLTQGAPRDLAVQQPSNPNGVPATATAVIVNITVTGASAGSFLSVWPSGVAQPGVSNLNFGAGQTIPNLAIIKIGTNGNIRFANAVGAVDLIVDVVGYFDPTGGSRFHAINPTRILDSRIPTGLAGPWGPNQTRSLPVAGAAGTNVPLGATGLVANVTATEGTTGSFITVYPDGVAVPTSSNVNFGAGETIPNLVTVKIPATGKVGFYNKLGTVDVIADAVGYYATT